MVIVLYLQILLQVSSYCASVVIILANLLADGKHIVPSFSHGWSHFMKNSYHFKIMFVLSQYAGLSFFQIYPSWMDSLTFFHWSVMITKPGMLSGVS